MKYNIRWVRPGGMGCERYEGVISVFAQDMQSAFDRARKEMSEIMCFSSWDLEMTIVGIEE